MNPFSRLNLNNNHGLLLIIISLIYLACSEPVPEHSQFFIGMTRNEVLGRFGKPKRSQVLTKYGNHIWGPIEDYWHKVPMGAKVEIWAYDSEMNMKSDKNSYMQEGQTELYFINDSGKVDGKGFYIKGAVYEGS